MTMAPLPNLSTLPNLDILENVNEAAIRARKVAAYRALNPVWRPAATDPLFMLLQTAAADEAMSREFLRAIVLMLFPFTSSGAALTWMGEFFGVPRRENEPDAMLARRIHDRIKLQRFAGSNGYYESQALEHDAELADAIVTADAAPNQGRARVHILATEDASEAQANNLLGVPSAAKVAATQAYLRDYDVRAVVDEDLVVQAAAPAEYRIAVTITPAAAHDAARPVIYQFIDDNREYNTIIYPSNLVTRLESAGIGVVSASVTEFGGAPFGDGAVVNLQASNATVWDCPKNATGVAIS